MQIIATEFRSRPEAVAFMADIEARPCTFISMNAYCHSWDVPDGESPEWTYIVKQITYPNYKSRGRRTTFREIETSGPYRGTLADEAVGF